MTAHSAKRTDGTRYREEGYPIEATNGYIPALDGMRAGSILLVVVAHLGLHEVVPGGLGVTVFFFISGFLITRLLFAEMSRSGHVNLPRFYYRRFLRLAPALLVMIAITSTAVSIARHTVPWREILSALFYFVNYYIFIHPGFALPIRPVWSLAVEEHYYVAFPFLFLLLARMPARFTSILASLCVAVLTWRCILVFGFGVPVDVALPKLPYTYLATECRIDAILFGAVLSVCTQREWGKRLVQRLLTWPFFLAGMALMLATLLFRNPEFRETFRYSLQSMALFVLVPCCLFGPSFALFRRVLEQTLLVWIGKVSYSMYLWHAIVIRVVVDQMPNASLVQIALVSVPGILLTSAASYYLVERPVLSLRARLRAKSLSGGGGQPIREHSPDAEPLPSEAATPAG